MWKWRINPNHRSPSRQLAVFQVSVFVEEDVEDFLTIMAEAVVIIIICRIDLYKFLCLYHQLVWDRMAVSIHTEGRASLLRNVPCVCEQASRIIFVIIVVIV